MKFALLFSFVLVTASLHADDDTDATFRNWDNRLHALESKTRGSCTIMPPARPTQKCDWGAYVTLDPLWLKAEENGLGFVAVTESNGQIAIKVGSNYISGKTTYKTVHPKLDWGFRIGVGLNLPHDSWEIFAHWTRFRTHADRHVKADPNTLLTPTFLSNQFAFNTSVRPPILTVAAVNEAFLTEASSHWELHLNEIDLEIGRQFFASKWLTFKPHAGLRSAWIRQKDKIAYKNFFQPVPGSTAVNAAFQNMTCNYWGIGLLGGLETEWGVGCGWSLFADCSASILYGYFQTTSQESDRGVAVITQTRPNPPLLVPFDEELFNAPDFYHVNRFITEYITGIRYDYMFCDERYHLGFQMGWEMHIFFGQNQFLRLFGEPVSLFDKRTVFPAKSVTYQDDLTLQGLSMQVQFDF